MSLRKFFERLGEAILHPSIPKPKLPRVRKRPGPPQVPRPLRRYFEGKGMGWSEYVILKVQVAFLLSLLFAVCAIFSFWLVLPLALVSVYLLSLLPQLKTAFGEDYPAYRFFLFLCFLLPWFLFLTRFGPLFVLAGLGFLLVSVSIFRIRYGREFTYGVVEKIMGGKALVRVGYDIRSDTKAGLYLAEAPLKVKKGQKVKVRVERPLFGLKGSKVGPIIEVANVTKRNKM
jgi:uncharacterized membrane protein